MRAVEITIIVVSYGTREMTLRCLDSVVQETRDASYELVVVDNGSADDSAAAIAMRFPEARLVSLRENLGFGAACNLGARDCRGKYVLLLNPDAIVKQRGIERLLARARQVPHAGIWGGRTVFEDGALNPGSCWRRPTLWNQFCAGLALNTRFPNSPLFNSLGYGGWSRNSARWVDVISGCFMLVERQVWQRLEGFSPEFFMYGEDTDLCLRAWRLGFRPYFVPEAVVIHAGGGTEPDKARRLRQVLAARILLVRKHFSPALRPLALLLIALRPMIGRLAARRDLRALWRDVWARRGDWLAGRY
jgi:GT2 family glycosyltransferase